MIFRACGGSRLVHLLPERALRENRPDDHQTFGLRRDLIGKVAKDQHKAKRDQDGDDPPVARHDGAPDAPRLAHAGKRDASRQP